MEHECCPRCGAADYRELPVRDIVQCSGCRMIYSAELPVRLVRLRPLQSVAQRIEKSFQWPICRGILRRWLRTTKARVGGWLVTERGVSSGPTQLLSAAEFALRYELAANVSEAEILRRQLEAINFDRSAWLACDGMVKRIALHIHNNFGEQIAHGDHVGMNLDEIVIHYLSKYQEQRDSSGRG